MCVNLIFFSFSVKMKTIKITHTGCHPQLVVKTKYVYTVQRAKVSYHHPLSPVRCPWIDLSLTVQWNFLCRHTSLRAATYKLCHAGELLGLVDSLMGECVDPRARLPGFRSYVCPLPPVWPGENYLACPRALVYPAIKWGQYYILVCVGGLSELMHVKHLEELAVAILIFQDLHGAFYWSLSPNFSPDIISHVAPPCPDIRFRSWCWCAVILYPSPCPTLTTQ